MPMRSALASTAAQLSVVLLVAMTARANAQSVAKLAVSPASSSCAQPVDVMVTLTEPARPGGFIVPLKSSMPAARRTP